MCCHASAFDPGKPCVTWVKGVCQKKVFSRKDGLDRDIGVKRNAERYKFWEPRLRVDPVWARSRRSRFSMCKVQAALNFLVTFAKRRTFGPKIASCAYYLICGHKSQFWGPKRTFGSKIDFGPKRPPFRLKFHWFYKHPRHGDAKTHFHSKIYFLHRKSLFASGNELLVQNRLLSKISTFWSPCAPSRQNG